MRSEKLPLYRPWIGEEEIAAVAEVLRSGWIGMGRRVEEFEHRFAERIGVPHAIAVNSCTAALHLALVAADIGPGDEVVTTPFTFTATAEAILHAGAVPRFVDIEPETLNLDPGAVAEAIGPRTRAILPVHLAGHPCPMDRLEELADRHGLFLLDDAAHALPARWKDRPIGAWGSASAFSFYPTKNLTTIEGGMVTTSNSALAERVRRIRYHAFSRDTWQRQSAEQPWAYDILEQGYKCNMTDVQAAVGLVQLEKLEAGMRIRRRIVAQYRRAFAPLELFDLPQEPEEGEHAWHLYIVRLRPERLRIGRDRLVAELNRRNIGASVHYIPLHLFTHYQKRCGVRPGDFPRAEEAFARVLSLPLWPGMSAQDAQDVIAAVQEIVEEFGA
ncbi:MAG: spore coat protein [Candidatus Poribacteria bacterium]|nr:MAG: spore coat protein [Candidatus Poribacteria bacterium]